MVGAREIWVELAAASREALPLRCLGCRRPVSARLASDVAATHLGSFDLCGRCRHELERSPGYPLLGDGIDDGFAPVAYTGAARQLIAALKFSRLLSVAGLCAELIAAETPQRLLTGTIVPAPASPIRSLTRGFDPAEAIASRLARQTGLAYQPHALRRRDLRRQRGRDRRARLARPPRVAAVEPIAGEVLLVDDVSTTGATLDACARALRMAGACRVRAIVFATVPPPSRKNR